VALAQWNHWATGLVRMHLHLHPIVSNLIAGLKNDYLYFAHQHQGVAEEALYTNVGTHVSLTFTLFQH
jgi:hypothetical protein